MTDKIFSGNSNPLGKTTVYPSQYDPSLLFRIERSEKRDELMGSDACSEQFFKQNFYGEDIWNAYELSWLNSNGLPQVACAEIRVKAKSSYIVESKSLKLYLNSLNQTQFNDRQAVIDTIEKDLSEVVGDSVSVKFYDVNDIQSLSIENFSGELIDEFDGKIEHYDYSPELLQNAIDSKHIVEEALISHLLRSNCLITNQPDWASIKISYTGAKINREALLRYLIAFRWHNEFHEQCVERIYRDIKYYCKPEKLCVYARYTRRGGLDINPWRSDFDRQELNLRLARQ
jgi:7-cyano-7-deazaguanine reductase